MALWKPKYAARGPRYGPCAINDGRVEVVTLGGFWHMGMLQTGCVAGDPLCQGAAVAIRVGKAGATDGPEFAFQADGEPLGLLKAPFTLLVRRVRAPSFLHNASAVRLESPVQY